MVHSFHNFHDLPLLCEIIRGYLMPGEQYVFLINPIKSHPSIFNIEYLHVGPSSDYTKPGFLGGYPI